MKITDFKIGQLIKITFPNGNTLKGRIFEINEPGKMVMYTVIKGDEIPDHLFTFIDGTQPKEIHFAAVD